MQLEARHALKQVTWSPRLFKTRRVGSVALRTSTLHGVHTKSNASSFPFAYLCKHLNISTRRSLIIASASGDSPKADNDLSTVTGPQRETERKPTKKRAREFVTTPDYYDKRATRKHFKRASKSSKIMDMPVDIFLEVRLGSYGK